MQKMTFPFFPSMPRSSVRLLAASPEKEREKASARAKEFPPSPLLSSFLSDAGFIPLH